MKKKNLRVHGWWHNHKYRHWLRSSEDYRQAKNLRGQINEVWWIGKYWLLHDELIVHGLDPSGCSETHTMIIKRFLDL